LAGPVSERGAERIGVRRIGVVVPARDEGPRLERCLRAIDRAAAAVDRPVLVVLVLDSCTDDSAARAARLRLALPVRLEVLTARYAAAGAARAAGAERLLAALGTGGTWLATTDADSTVPANWLAEQVRLAESGKDLVAGTVTVRDWEDRPAAVRLRAEVEYAVALAETGHGHVHGANLGISAAWYRRVGGFVPVACDEDVLLVAAARAAGAHVGWASGIAVTTSARSQARAPGGFAAYLDDLADLADLADLDDLAAEDGEAAS
jgi:glycosyltransferase involved in cell wall biosynthesis